MFLKSFKNSIRHALLGVFKMSIGVAALLGTISIASELTSAASRLVPLLESLESALTFVLWMLFLGTLTALADAYKETRKSKTRHNLPTRFLDMLLVEEMNLGAEIDSKQELAESTGTTTRQKPSRETVEDQPSEVAEGPHIDSILEARVMTSLENLRERQRWVEKHILTQFEVVKIIFLTIGAIAAAFGIAAGALRIFPR